MANTVVQSMRPEIAAVLRTSQRRVADSSLKYRQLIMLL